MTVNAPTDQAPIFALDRAASAIASVRRAAVADRYAADSLAVEWREASQLEAIANEWRELAARALEPNVFYEPAFALAAAGVFARGGGAMVVWSGSSPRQLLGVFPARIEPRRYGLNAPVLVGWTPPDGPLGTPLVEREAAEPVIAAWLAHISGNQTLPGVLLLPSITAEGPFATTLGAILRRAQMPAAAFSRHRRALLAPSGDPAVYVEQALGARKLNELRRMGRRLAELGAVLFTSATEPTAISACVDDFFAIEASGRRGKAGAIAASDDIHRFIKTALTGLAAEGKVTINRLLLDARAIAVTIRLRSGDGVWLWKIAYDEGFARYSPGVLLTITVTEDIIENATMARADSCTAANQPLIDDIWRERLALCDILFAVRPQAPFARMRQCETLRRGAIAAIRSVRGRFD
ncbi:MAG TPA: GNAT family N-acetyltransferase [Xanthobacteraceae bacterium]|jgi:CelD/BcsL family acetyltransferase involved in cellulose biosynthesis